MFKMIRGVQINNGVLTNTTVPEEIVAAWDSGTTYSEGARAGSAVTDGEPQRVYESLQDGNTNHDLTDTDWWRYLSDVYPVYSTVATYANGDIVTDLSSHSLYESLQDGNTNHPLTDADWWKRKSATNAYMMFDPVVQDQTIVNGGFEVSISDAAEFITSAGFLNVNATAIKVEMISGGDIVFSQTYDMNEAPSQAGFWWWLFEPIQRKTSLYVDSLPTILGATITVTFFGEGAVACGIMSAGESVIIGSTMYGANYSIISYSQKQEDASGRVSISKGGYRDVVDVPVMIDNPSFGATTRILNANRDTPAIWSISDEYPMVYGFYDRYDLMLGHPKYSELTIRLEGLV